MSMSIAKKSNIAGILLFIVSVLLGATSIFVAYEYKKDIKTATTSSSVMRDLMNGDMMHDGIRADVLAALLAVNPAGSVYKPDQVAKDIGEHTAFFLESMASAKEKVTDKQLLEYFENVQTPLQEYVKSAKSISASMSQGEDAVKAQVPAFLEKFENLEGALGELSGHVEEKANQHEAEASNLSSVSIYIVIAILLLTMASIFYIISVAKKDVTNPLSNLTDVMSAIADGNLEIDAPYTNRSDEIGSLANALLKFKENALKRVELEKNEIKSVEQRNKRVLVIEEITQEFSKTLSDSLVTLSSTSQELQANASQMGSMAAQTESLTVEALHSANEASESVNSIAAASNQLSSTIEEIVRQINKSSEIANQAAILGKDSESSISDLTRAVEEISEVLQLIETVSEQTNLLALNATIEAARAGEAGKGFAVVASEVKALASQTASATQDITDRIEKVKQVSNFVTQNMANVINMVEQMNEITAQSSSSVQEQSKATLMIAENASMASNGTNNATSNVHTLSQSAHEASEASKSLSLAASDVAARTSILSHSAEEFFAKLKAV